MIHQYINNGYHIVLDVNSGSVHVVDKMVYELIAFVKEEKQNESKIDEETITKTVNHFQGVYAENDVREALEELNELIEAGQLFTEDIYEPYVKDFKKRETVVKALCLHIAHDCNLACKYCFAEEGEYHGRRALMSFEVGKKALDFLIAHSGSRRNLEVDFFGGEPLMNFDVVKRIVAYGRELEKTHNKKFRFTITTNCYDVPADAPDFCDREMHNVVLSLDGRKNVHDAVRPVHGGGGSYDRAVENARKLVAHRQDKDYYARGTFTKRNLDFAEDAEALFDAGFEHISIEPVVLEKGHPLAITEEDLPGKIGRAHV